MAQFIYYQDGNEKKGPLDEKTVLELYNGAEFTSDVAFQIRSSETDDAAPFIQLRDLISKNGPSNPFCGDLDRRIEEAEKELEELRAIVGRKEQLEETIAKIEKVAASFPELFDAKKAESDGTAPSTSGEKKKGKLHKCTSCGLMLANCKQALIHSHRDCPCFTPKDEGVVPDIARWKEEDEGRLSMGRRLFDRMKEEEKGNARPRVDFMEDLSLKLKKFMSFATDEGREKSMEYLESAEAKKVNDRFEKHLEGAKGMLVCNRCKVACKTHVHFRIHLATYDHRIKVKSTPCELISLLMGWFNRDLYLRKADPSELDEGVDPVSQLSMDSLRLTGDETTLEGGPTESKEGRDESGGEGDYPDEYYPDECTGEGLRGLMEMMTTPGGMKQHLIDDLSQRTIVSCTECNAMYTNFKQFLVHVGSDQHVGNVKKVNQSQEEAEADQRGHEDVLRMVDSDLQRWRWADRANLAAGKQVWGGWSEEEKREARPTEQFVEQINDQMAKKIKKKGNGKYEEYFIVAERYFVSSEAKALMDGVEKHLKETKKFACIPCKFGCRDANSYYIHCMTYDHVRITQGTAYELPTVLIGIHKKNLYV